MSRRLDDSAKAFTPGFDNIFENTLFKHPPPPPKYLFIDTKYNMTDVSRTPRAWINKLGKSKQYGRQMGDRWFRHHLDEFDNEMAEEYVRKPDYFVRGLAGVSKRGDLVELFELTNDATTITRIDHFTP